MVNSLALTEKNGHSTLLAIKRARFIGLIPYAISHKTERGFAGDIQNVIQSFTSASMRTGRPMGGTHSPRVEERAHHDRDEDDFDDGDE